MKRKIIALLLVTSISSMISAPVLAADNEKVSGFYDIGTKYDVVVKPFSGNIQISAIEKNLDSDSALEKLYENSDRLEVTYSAASNGDHYGIIMVEGSGLPTKDTEIYYIDQVTARSESVGFNVYPKLPESTTDMTIYISSSEDEFGLINIPLNYAVNVTTGSGDSTGGGNDGESTPSYIMGDIFTDNEVNSKDAVKLAQYLARWPITFTDNEMKAADVVKDGKVDSKDAVKLAQYLARWGITLE